MEQLLSLILDFFTENYMSLSIISIILTVVYLASYSLLFRLYNRQSELEQKLYSREIVNDQRGPMLAASMANSCKPNMNGFIATIFDLIEKGYLININGDRNIDSFNYDYKLVINKESNYDIKYHEKLVVDYFFKGYESINLKDRLKVYKENKSSRREANSVSNIIEKVYSNIIYGEGLAINPIIFIVLVIFVAVNFMLSITAITNKISSQIPEVGLENAIKLIVICCVLAPIITIILNVTAGVLTGILTRIIMGALTLSKYVLSKSKKDSSLSFLYCMYIVPISVIIIMYILGSKGILDLIIIVIFINNLIILPNFREFRKKNESIEIESMKWKGLYNYLNEFSSLKDKPSSQYIMYNQYMIYAMAFGIADLTEKEFYNPETQSQMDEIYEDVIKVITLK